MCKLRKELNFMYYPITNFNNRHQKVSVSKDSVMNMLKWASRIAFSLPMPAFSLHQTLTFPIEIKDAKTAKNTFNKFLKSLFKKYEKFDLAAFYMTERRKNDGIHYHIFFFFFDGANLPSPLSRMEKEFRSDVFKRWNELNGGDCVHPANSLKIQAFTKNTIAYFVKTLRIPKKQTPRSDTINWGIRGKTVLMKYTKENPKELAKQLFEKLFVERIRGKRGSKLLSEKIATGARAYTIKPAQNSRIESEISTRFNSPHGITQDLEECQTVDATIENEQQAVTF